jgi:glycosyltransferase involved in cell wall biosynthesis
VKKNINNKNLANSIIHIVRKFQVYPVLGGVEQFIYQLSLNTKIKHIVLACNENSSREIVVHKNLRIKYFKNFIKILNDVFSLDIYRFLCSNSNNYQLIHLHQPQPSSFFYIFLLPLKKKIIVTHHSDILRYTFLKYLVFFLRKLVSNKINFYHISTSIYKKSSELKHVKNFFIESFSVKKKLINTKININFLEKIPDKYVLYIGRHRHYKGLEKLEKIILLNLDVNFVCVTNYFFNSKPKNLIKFTSVKDHEKDYLLKNSSMLVFTSDNRAESFGFVVLEALSHGIPAIVFKLRSGTNYLIKDNYNGYIINKFDLNHFSLRIRKLYYNDELLKKFKFNAISDFKKRLQHNYPIINKFYNKLLYNLR